MLVLGRFSALSFHFLKHALNKNFAYNAFIGNLLLVDSFTEVAKVVMAGFRLRFAFGDSSGGLGFLRLRLSFIFLLFNHC